MIKTHAVTIVLALTAACPPAARADARPVTCTNTASGATWQISIDIGRATVDTYPAQVGDRELAWHDLRDNGRYRLDRTSGALTVSIPSSTGGWFLHDRCDLKQIASLPQTR